MGQVRGNGAANAARPGDRRAFTSLYASGCREPQRELMVTEVIEVLDPAGFLGSLVGNAIWLRGVTNRNLWSQSVEVSASRSALLPGGSMPVIRFVREGRDVECFPGENLRAVAMREGIQLYGLKGQLGNCGGCGQCSTCFVKVEGESSSAALSPRTAVEETKLRRRPAGWRLACQSLVEQSVVVVTKPQASMPDQGRRVAAALAAPLPPGPLEWPGASAADEDADDVSADDQSIQALEVATQVSPATPGEER